MRKLVINAQVKATISLLETVFNIVYIITLWFTVRTSFGTVLQGMGLYMVFLPYAALMNTSHNKERVVEHGWKNVFRNLIGRKSNTEILQTDNKDTNLTNKDRLQQGFIKSKNHPLDHCVSEKCSTISSDNITDRSKVVDLFKQASLGDEPCTSNRQKAESKAYSHLSDTSSISPQHQNKNENITQTLILKMIENINKEEIYIENFKNIVAHIHGGKNESIPSAFPLEVNMLPNFVSEDELFYTNTRCKGKHSNQPMTELSKDRRSGILMNVEELGELGNQQKMFLGNKDDRIKMRGHLLDQLVNYDEHDEIYDSLLDKLIDLEESFVR